MLHNLQTGLGSFWAGLWIDGKEVGVVLNKNKYDKTGWLSAIWKVFKSNRLPSVYQIFVKASSWPLLCFLRAKQKQSMGILILPLSCSCSNKVKTNKQTNKVKTMALIQASHSANKKIHGVNTNKQNENNFFPSLQLSLTNKNKHAKWKQQHYRNSYKSIHHCGVSLITVLRLKVPWFCQNLNYLVHLHHLIYIETSFWWWSPYSVAALVSHFPLEGEGGPSRLWSRDGIFTFYAR